jgi:hypothetical protein
MAAAPPIRRGPLICWRETAAPPGRPAQSDRSHSASRPTLCCSAWPRTTIDRLSHCSAQSGCSIRPCPAREICVPRAGPSLIVHGTSLRACPPLAPRGPDGARRVCLAHMPPAEGRLLHRRSQANRRQGPAEPARCGRHHHDGAVPRPGPQLRLALHRISCGARRRVRQHIKGREPDLLRATGQSCDYGQRLHLHGLH